MTLRMLAALTLLAAPAAVFSAQAQAMPPQVSTPSAEVQNSYKHLKENILKAADKMPAADYQFKGTPEIRTFARVVNHITEAQQHTCTALNGSKFDAKTVPSDTADKAAIFAGLQASFAECDKAYAALNDADLMSKVSFGPMTRSRIGAAWGNVSHDNEQYAILSIYLRLKNILPPTVEK